MLLFKKILKIFFLVFCLSIFSFSTPAFSQEKPIARLADFSGTVLINSQGSWAVKPVKNLPLYSIADRPGRAINTAITVNPASRIPPKTAAEIAKAPKTPSAEKYGVPEPV